MSKRQSVLLDQLRGSMPEDVKYVTIDRCPNMMALDVFFLVGDEWFVVRKVDYESIHRRGSENILSGAEVFWEATQNGGGYKPAGSDQLCEIKVEETDVEPPKRWAAANDVAQTLLYDFKLGKEFCEHKGWDFHACVTLTLAEQESMAGDILEFIKPLLMKEVDAPFPRRLPLPTVPCSECGAGVTMRRIEDATVAGKDSVMVEGHIREDSGKFIIRCYKCPPTIGPIKCDSGPVEVEKPEPLKLLPQNEDVWNGKEITMDECEKRASGGCTCGAWVTPGARHDGYCELAE